MNPVRYMMNAASQSRRSMRQQANQQRDRRITAHQQWDKRAMAPIQQLPKTPNRSGSRFGAPAMQGAGRPMMQGSGYGGAPQMPMQQQQQANNFDLGEYGQSYQAPNPQGADYADYQTPYGEAYSDNTEGWTQEDHQIAGQKKTNDPRFWGFKSTPSQLKQAEMETWKSYY